MSRDTRLSSPGDGVARIALNRPEVRHALSRQLVQEREAALAGYAADPEARSGTPWGRGARAGQPTGSATRIVVPWPGLLSTSIEPPCMCTMLRLIESPSPVPRPSPFVV